MIDFLEGWELKDNEEYDEFKKLYELFLEAEESMRIALSIAHLVSESCWIKENDAYISFIKNLDRLMHNAEAAAIALVERVFDALYFETKITGYRYMLNKSFSCDLFKEKEEGYALTLVIFLESFFADREREIAEVRKDLETLLSTVQFESEENRTA